MNFKNNQGAVLVEMAIILPLLFLIVFGIFEFSRAMVITNTLNNAAREGARRAAVSAPAFNVESFVRDAIPFDKNGIDIHKEPLSPVPGSGEAVRVTVTLPFTPVTNFIPALNDITLRGEASMRYEYTGP